MCAQRVVLASAGTLPDREGLYTNGEAEGTVVPLRLCATSHRPVMGVWTKRGKSSTAGSARVFVDPHRSASADGRGYPHRADAGKFPLPAPVRKPIIAQSDTDSVLAKWAGPTAEIGRSAVRKYKSLPTTLYQTSVLI